MKAYVVDDCTFFNHYTIRLHSIVRERAYDIIGEYLEDHEDGKDFINHCGYLIGVIEC